MLRPEYTIDVRMPVRYTIRKLVRTAQYAKETRQYSLLRECRWEIREQWKGREKCSL